jgi:hypothetical protein
VEIVGEMSYEASRRGIVLLLYNCNTPASSPNFNETAHAGLVRFWGAGAEGGEMKARLWNSLRRRMGSCRGYMMAVGVEGHLASLEGGCRLRCGGEEDRAIAYLIEDAEVGLAKEQQQQRLAEEAAVAEAGSSVASLMKESTLDQHCQ